MSLGRDSETGWVEGNLCRTVITIYDVGKLGGKANLVRGVIISKEGKVLSDSPEPVGARLIAYRLRDYGIYLGERAVRYHLKLLDERGLTHLVGKKEGRLITQSGLSELDSALVGDRVGSAMAKIGDVDLSDPI